MKLRTETREVTVTSAQQNKGTITANAKAFKALIDNLYSDKPKSVTQEIWSNAYDAHCMAGCPDKPFLVNLPSRWEPEFWCRDYGTGLSHDEVMNLYLNLFYSTKEEDNTGVGMWGLGSKIPFAYTDTFTVTSWQNGVVRYYTMLKDERGIPTVNFMGESGTNEPDGLEVRFPVRSGDIDKFVEAANRVVKGFAVPPLVHEQPDHQWETFDVVLEDDDFMLLSKGNTPYAKMGCVVYPIKSERLTGCDFVSGLPMVVKFDIGDIDITVSREDISYDPQTIAAIETKLKSVRDKLLADMVKQINSKDHPWEKAKEYIRVRSPLSYNMNRELQKVVNIPTSVSLRDVSFKLSEAYSKSYFSGWNAVKHPKFSSPSYVKNTLTAVKTTIFVEDTTSDVRAGKRIKQYVEQAKEDLGYIYWVKLSGEDKQHLDDFNYLTETVLEEYVFVSDIPDPGPDKRSGKSQPVKVQVIDSGRSSWRSIELPDLDKTEGCYIKTERNYFDYTGAPVGGNPERFTNLFKTMGVYFDLYTAPKTYWKRFENAEKLTNIWDFIRQWLDNNRHKFSEYCSRTVLTDAHLRRRIESTSSEWVKERLAVPRQQFGVDVKTAREIATHFRIEYKEDRDITEEIYQRYPLLRLALNADTQHIEDYIQMIDNKLKGN